MKKSIMILTCTVLSLTLTGCEGCNKKEEPVPVENNIEVVNEIDDEADFTGEDNADMERVAETEEAQRRKSLAKQQDENGNIKIVDSSEIFGKWATADKSMIMEIVSDDMSPEEIQGDSYLLLSKDKSEFNIFRLEEDKIIVDGVDYHEYYFENFRLHIFFDDKEYVLDRITDQEYNAIYDKLVNTNPSKVDDLDIPEEEILDTTSIEGLWVDVKGESMLNVENGRSSFTTYRKKISGEFKMGDDEGMYPNLLIITDNVQFFTEFKNDHLFLSNAFTGETIEMEKVKEVLYPDYNSKIYYGE